MSKFYIALLLFTFSTFYAYSQDSTKVKKKSEYFLTVSDFSPLSLALKYKKQIKNLRYFKLGIINLNASQSHYKPSSSSTFPFTRANYSAGIEFGFEFRKNISGFLTFYHGINLNCTYIYNVEKIENPALPISERKSHYYTLSPGISYSLGLMGKITNNVLIAFDINPGVIFRYSENNYSDPYNSSVNTSVDFNLENDFVQLSLVFRP